MTTYKEGDRVSFNYAPETSNEIILVEGVVSKPSTGRPLIVKLDTPRIRPDSRKPQEYITIRPERIQPKFSLAS
jgi:hypothetical protein